MSILLRISALFAVLALLGAGVAEARGGRGGGSASRGGGSSFGRSSSSSFGRSSSGRSSFGRSTFGRSSMPSRSTFSRATTPSRSSAFRRATPSTTRSVSPRTVTRTPSPTVRSAPTTTTRSQFTAPPTSSRTVTGRSTATRTTGTPANTVRNEAALSRLRTWSSARNGSTPPSSATRSTRSAFTPQGATQRTRTGTVASSNGDTRTALRSRFGNQATATRPTTTRTLSSSNPATRSTASRGTISTRARTVGTRNARSFGGAAQASGSRGSATRGTSGFRGATATAGRARGGSTATRGRSGRGEVRVGSSRGGPAYAAARRGSVRYSGHGGYTGYRHHGGHGYGYGYGYGPRWCRPWGGGFYWGYPCGGWGWGVGIGIGVGLGYTMAYWDPWYYDCYGSYWVNGAPPFGFGTVSYGPTYNTYIVEDGSGDPVALPAGPQVQPQGAADQPAPADAPNPEVDAPGYAEFGLGVEAFLDGDYPGALQQFRVAVQADEENGEAWMAVAQSAFAVGAFDESAEAITRAAELGAFPRGYRYDPSPMYPVEGRFDKLLSRLETFREQHPENADAHLVAAYLHVALGHKDEADAAITSVLQLRPEDEAAPALTMALLPPVPPQKLPGANPPAPAEAAPAAPAAR